MKWKLFSSGRVIASVLVFALAGSAFAEKSMWQKFKDFFNPGESIDCEGPVCDQIHNLDSQISKTEGKYSRERRPVNKERYKKELDSLNVVRDSLVTLVKGQQAADSLRAASSADAKSTDAIASSSSATVVQSSSAGSSSAALISSAVVAVCKPDTVFVHDTIRVHDTLYVMLANKPLAPETPAETAPTGTAPAETVPAEIAPSDSANVSK